MNEADRRTESGRDDPANAGTTLAGGRVVTPDGVLDPGWVRIGGYAPGLHGGGRIAEVGGGQPPEEHGAADREIVDLAGQWVVPGFVDLHCHGGGTADFAVTDSGAASADRVATVARAHLRHGTTTMLASLVSAPVDELAARVRALRELAVDGLIAGIHLEGPFLSAARCGAHDPEVLRPPDPDSVATLLEAGAGSVRMITLAPELTGATNAVRRIAGSGAIAAIGHTDATADQVRPAVDAGASVATHLFNGMRPLHHREPGAVGALLADDRVTIELICDLVHVHPDVVALAAHHAGPHRTVLVTDAIGAAAASDGSYELGGLGVTVSGGEPRLDDGSLAGSSLTTDVAFRNFVRGAGMSVPDAVRASATRPAELLGLGDEVGSLRRGLRADLVVLDEDLRPRHVMHRGEWVRSDA